MFARISRIALVAFLLVALGGVLEANAQTNKEIVQRMADEIWNQGNLDAADELFAADFVNHDPNPAPNPGDVTDLESYKGWVVEYLNAYPDYHVEVHDMVAEGDKVGARYTATGTHQGDFFGIEATGNQVTMTMVNVYRLAGGKIVEAWWSYDMLGMLEQIGFIEPEAAGPPFLHRNPEDYPWGEPTDVTGDPGDPEANKALCIADLEGWNKGDADISLELIAPTFIFHDPIWPSVTDYESYTQFIEGMFDPDNPGNITIEDLIAEGDKVVERWTAVTAQGGILPGMNIYRFAEGKIVELWRSMDALLLLIGGPVDPLPDARTAVESSTWGQVKSLFK